MQLLEKGICCLPADMYRSFPLNINISIAFIRQITRDSIQNWKPILLGITNTDIWMSVIV